MFRVAAFLNKKEDKGRCPRLWVTEELCGPKHCLKQPPALPRDPLCCRENPRVCNKGFTPRILSGEHSSKELCIFYPLELHLSNQGCNKTGLGCFTENVL